MFALAEPFAGLLDIESAGRWFQHHRRWLAGAAYPGGITIGDVDEPGDSALGTRI
jgi:hypothetical protein